MNVDDDRIVDARASSGRGDRFDRDGKTTAVIPVPVRQEDRVDRGEVDAEAVGVVDPDVAVGADVEQHRVALVADPTRQENRQPVTGHAQVIEHRDAVVAGVLAHGWSTCQVRSHFRQLRHTGVDARQRVGLVVDDDRQSLRRAVGIWLLRSSSPPVVSGCRSQLITP